MNRKIDTYSLKSLVAIHKILKFYDDNLDADNIDMEALNAKSLKLSKAEYIENVGIKEWSIFG